MQEERWERRADVMPTGKVVGILERNWREYIATIPKEDAGALMKKSGETSESQSHSLSSDLFRPSLLVQENAYWHALTTTAFRKSAF